MNEATIRTTHDDPETVAAAIDPDNTPEVQTRVFDDTVETTITRETIGGLDATITDYLRAVAVADETVRLVTADTEVHS